MSKFFDAFRHIDAGNASAETDEQLAEILKAVRATGKKGSVTITLEVAPNGDRGFEVTTKITAKAPQVSFGKAFFFTDRDGHLTRKAPAEEAQELLRPIEGGKGADA